MSEESPNAFVESYENIPEVEFVDKNDVALKTEPLDNVLRLMYSNKEKSDISEP